MKSGSIACVLAMCLMARLPAIEQDEDVRPPVADAVPKNPAARIVLNIFEDGTVKSAEDNVLADDQALSDHIGNERARIERLGLVPKLHLRGDKNSVFKHSRRLIRIGKDAGVEQVVFAAYELKKEPPQADSGIKRENVPLPEKADAPGDGGNGLLIRIDSKGNISLVDGDKPVPMDATADGRELPFLKMNVQAMVRKAGGDPAKVPVSIQADGKTSQQRVVDVLNVLSGEKINKVTFILPDGK